MNTDNTIIGPGFFKEVPKKGRVAPNVSDIKEWEVVSFIGNSTDPQSIIRLSDGKVFSIGGHVTNGTQMHGRIERFEYSFKGNDIYVFTDWSGVGMNLASLAEYRPLPSGHQLGEPVHLVFGNEGTLTHCKVIKVHFTESKVLYDIEVSGNFDAWKDVVDQEDVKKNNIWSTRLYNVDSCFVTKPV